MFITESSSHRFHNIFFKENGLFAAALYTVSILNFKNNCLIVLLKKLQVFNLFIRASIT